jgi:hypothetical protein
MAVSDISASAGAHSLVKTLSLGVPLGLVLFLAMRQVADLGSPGLEGNAALVSVLMAMAIGLVGFYLAARAPQEAAAAGATILLLVTIGLVIGSASDITLIGGGWDPVSIVRFTAHQPLTALTGGGLLGVALACRRRSG